MYLTCPNPKYTHQCERASGYYTSDNNILLNVHKIEGVNNHYAKFDGRLMETMSKFNTPQKRENIYQMCTKLRVHILNV